MEFAAESPKEHLLTSIAEVLRLRAIKPIVCDRSAKRFAQDDGFVWGLEIQLESADAKGQPALGRETP
jgi:hypothetical protein